MPALSGASCYGNPPSSRVDLDISLSSIAVTRITCSSALAAPSRALIRSPSTSGKTQAQTFACRADFPDPGRWFTGIVPTIDVNAHFTFTMHPAALTRHCGDKRWDTRRWIQLSTSSALGRVLGAKRALKPQQVWAIRFWLDQHRRLRDRALFDFAIDSKLRGCDVVKVRIGNIVAGGRIRDRAIVVQQKTKRPVQFELVAPARKTLLVWLERRGGTLNDFVFPSRNDYMGHMNTRQYARLVREWIVGIGLQAADYGTHSLRRTKASIIYKATGNLRAVQILLGQAERAQQT